MQLLPFSVQFNRATKRPDFAKIEGSLALVNFIRNNLEVRSRIKNWNKLGANELATSAITLFNKQKFQRARTWIYDKIHPTKTTGVLFAALLASESTWDVNVEGDKIQYTKDGVVIKEIQLGKAQYTEEEFCD